MNRILRAKSMSIFNVFMFYLILLFQKSSGAHPMYEACVPTRCDKGPDIMYPFYIRDKQEPFCGLFEITCSSFGHPMIYIPDNSCVIDQIFYQNHSFRAHIAAADGFSNEYCPLRSVRNITLNTRGRWFNYTNESLTRLHLLLNCNDPLPDQLTKYKVTCDDDARDGLELAMLGNDENLNSAIEECATNVVAPVELHGDEGRNGMVDFRLLRRGFALNWTASNCSRCEESGGRCGARPQSNGFRCFCPYGPEYWSCKSGRRKNKSIIVLIIAAVSIGVISLLVILFFCFRKKFWKYVTEKNQELETFLKNCGSLAPKRYHYSDLKKMTNSFDTKLGQGGYGSVYKGKVKDGSLVAVKVLKESKGNGEDFINEVASISRTSHVNIVTLLGFCVQGQTKALIYEFMSNESLENFIYGENSLVNSQLEWPILYRIAIGIARGLEYLHSGCNTRILHFDIKPQNILLDEDFCPKISDFGLAKLCLRKESMISTMDARGTIGYIAPEVVCRNIGVISHKSDVYSYGMMVLEMVGGRKNVDVGVDRESAIYFPHWIYSRLSQGEELGLSGIMDEEENMLARKMLIVSLWCIQTHPSYRPTSTNVLEMLEGPLGALQMPPKPFFSSPPRASSEGSITVTS